MGYYISNDTKNSVWEEYVQTKKTLHLCQSPKGSYAFLRWCRQYEEHGELEACVSNENGSISFGVDHCPFCGFTLKDKIQ